MNFLEEFKKYLMDSVSLRALTASHSADVFLAHCRKVLKDR